MDTIIGKRLVFPGMSGFGESIKKFREKRDWSQQELAERAQVSVTAVSKLERGLHDPSRRTKRRLAEVFGVTVEELETGEETVTLALPRDLYDSIAARAKHEGHPSVVAFLAKVATSKTKRVSRPLPREGGRAEGKAAHAPQQT